MLHYDGIYAVTYLTEGGSAMPPRIRRPFVKFSAIYANFAIFLTPDGTKYATSSGGLHTRPPTGTSLLDPAGGLSSPRLPGLGPPFSKL